MIQTFGNTHSMLLHGKIEVAKRLRKHEVWNREPKCYGAAWIDLILLANDAPRTVHIHGEAIELKRGQLAWSKQRLEEEWGRSDAWVRAFLNFCQDKTMLTVKSSKRGTIITILNYDAYNPLVSDSASDLVSDSASDLVSDSASDLEQNGETGNGNREVGIGKGSKTPFQSGFPEQKKNPPARAITSPAQALFLLDRELAEVTGEIAELDDLCQPVPTAMKQRRRELEKKRREILVQGGVA